MIWSLNNCELESKSPVLLKLEGHDGVIMDVKFLKKDVVASVSDDRSLRIWRLFIDDDKYQQVGEFYGHRSRIWKIRELEYEGMLVTVSEDTTCKVWEVPSDLFDSKTTKIVNRSIETLKGHMGRNVRALACSGGLIATGGDDGAIKVWDAADILGK